MAPPHPQTTGQLLSEFQFYGSYKMEVKRPETTDEFIRYLGIRNTLKMKFPFHSVEVYGYLMVFGFASFGLVFLYAAIVSKMLPEFENYPVLNAIRNDYYFCYLIPLSILPTYSIIYLNWLSMRHFEQN